MARAAVSDWTTTVISKGIVGKKRRIYGSLAINSALTYTITTGIPLPTAVTLGFTKSLDVMFLVSNPEDGWLFKYDKANHSIRIYRTASVTPAGTIAAPIFTATAKTPAGTVSAPAFVGVTTAIATFSDPINVAGTVAAPVFTGTAMTIAGTISAPTFTGTATSAAVLTELTDNTALGSGTITLYYDAIGV